MSSDERGSPEKASEGTEWVAYQEDAPRLSQSHTEGPYEDYEIRSIPFQPEVRLTVAMH